MKSNKTDEPRYVLGLDVSTKTIGISLFADMGDSGELMWVKHLSPKASKLANKYQQLYDKANIFQNEFLSTVADIGIYRVIIEEPLINSNNVYTVSTLLKFNGMISKAVYDVLRVVPEYISSYDARCYGFPELMKVRTVKKNGEPILPSQLKKAEPVLFGAYPYDVDKKMVVWSLVNKNEPKINWLMNKKGQLLKENFDASDAYCAVKGFMNKNNLWKK